MRYKRREIKAWKFSGSHFFDFFTIRKIIVPTVSGILPKGSIMLYDYLEPFGKILFNHPYPSYKQLSVALHTHTHHLSI
jgi:hypothetical protein